MDQKIIFLHIGKTAGTTFNSIIDRNFDESEIFRFYEISSDQYVEKFKSLPKERANKIKIIAGHFNFGLHRYIPESCKYITFLRNPLERVISYYYYALRNTSHRHHRDLKKLTLQDFAESQTLLHVDNFQVRQISGLTLEEVPIGQCSEEILKIAKRNIVEHFSVVGISEQFDESLMLLNFEMGWKFPLYKKMNVTKTRPRNGLISPGIVYAN